MTTRDQLHRLIDQLPDGDLQSAELLLEYLRTGDPMLLALATAPVDDEPLTEQEEAGVAEAEAEIARGEGIPWERVKEHFRRPDAEAS